MAWTDIPGWVHFVPLYERAVREAKDGDVFVEVGVAYGKSIARLAQLVRESGKRITIYGVDPWLPDDGNDDHVPQSLAHLARSMGGPFSGFVKSMAQHALAELEAVRVLRIESPRAARLFDDRSLAMVLIDGDHRYDGVKADVAGWGPKVRVGGIFAGDDADRPEVHDAVASVLGQGGFDIQPPGTWVSKVVY